MELESSTILTWVGIALCLTQSAMFSGLNLALFSLGRLRLEAEVEKGNVSAGRVLKLRQDSNLLLCTILWGNVSVNVLLALLSESVLAGVWSFVFSTVGITFFGEIMPQAYFSRHALRVGAAFSPVMKFYKILLYPLAKPCAVILDGWIGPEGPTFFRERDVEIILEKHIREHDSEIGVTEGQGALNFLALDDRLVLSEGREVLVDTIVALPCKLDLPVFPETDASEKDAFLVQLKKHPTKRAVITDSESGDPRVVLETSAYLCALFSSDGAPVDIYQFCHRPIVVTDAETTLESVLSEFVVEPEHRDDWVIDRDVVLYWTPDLRRIITGEDILGRLLRGIARREPQESSA